MKMIRIFGYAVITAAVFLCGAVVPPAAACDCAQTTLGVHVDDAETIFTGQVTKRKEKDDQVEVVFTPRNVFKGNVLSEITVAVPGLDSESCGYPFQEGQTYLVFAATDSVSHNLSTGWCTPTNPAASPKAEQIIDALSDGLIESDEDVLITR